MKKARSVLVAIGLFALSKLKVLVGLLKFTKFGSTLISMLVSLWAYAVTSGWEFAFVVIYLMFVHEMGHLVAARIKGIRTSPAFFIPFVGALIAMKDQPRDAKTEAFIAYGGPLAGLLSILPAIPLYLWTGDRVWGLVILLGSFLNLFNLMPVSPLDGGRIVSVLSSKVWLLGLAGLGVFLYFHPGPIMIWIFILGLITWWNRRMEGFKKEVVQYEMRLLEWVLAEFKSWSELDDTREKREIYYSEYIRTSTFPKKRRFYFPFWEEKERLTETKLALEKKYSEQLWEVFSKWERTPVVFLDGDPNQPLPNEHLIGEICDAHKRLEELAKENHKLVTYYESAPSTKWKVLGAYLGLAAVLSVFSLYGYSMMG